LPVVIGGPAARICGPAVGSPASSSREFEREIAPVAEVPDGGDAGGQREPGTGPHRRENLLVVRVRQAGDRIGARVEHQMDVRVDEPGQQRRRAQVDHLGTGGRLFAGPDGDDPPGLDQHGRTLDRLGVDTVEESRSARMASMGNIGSGMRGGVGQKPGYGWPARAWTGCAPRDRNAGELDVLTPRETTLALGTRTDRRATATGQPVTRRR
jgi:hypothetical protein